MNECLIEVSGPEGSGAFSVVLYPQGASGGRSFRQGQFLLNEFLVGISGSEYNERRTIKSQ